jgi:hypothetical protein
MDPVFYDYQVRGLIKRLIAFLGNSTIENCIRKYRQSLGCSGPIFKEYYLKTRHPWWEPLSLFFDIEDSGKSLKNHLTSALKRLTRDAYMISDLQGKMPIKVREKFKRDLVDDNNASAYLLELHIGWHFHRRGFKVSWYEEDGKPEYCITTPGFAFDVECKRISNDAFKKIRRRDFYRFAEILIPQITGINLQGKLDLELYDRFHGNNQFIEDLCKRILTAIKTHGAEGVVNIPEGVLALNLREKGHILVDWETELMEINDWKSQGAHAAIFGEGHAGQVANPIGVAMKSRKRNEVLTGIKDKIQGAARKQLDPSKPGLIVCFLETITNRDLHELAENSGLQKMSSYILNKGEYKHVAALIFCAEEENSGPGEVENFSAKALTFRNPNCVFDQAKDFPFLDGT